jgi:hypothetical protein
MFSGSVAKRPEYAMLGKFGEVPFEVLYPSAMLPRRSAARLPIHRFNVVSGA